MGKIPNWSRADEVFEDDPNVLMAWEHDKITQRVSVVRKENTRYNNTYYELMQHNYPNGFDDRGYSEQANNPTWDGQNEALEAARAQLKANPDGLTVTNLASSANTITVEDLPRKKPPTTEVEKYASPDQAEKMLKKKFSDFDEDGETFFFEETVHGTDGFTAVISVDWATEFSEDFAGVANVIAFKEDQPSTDMEEVKESDAVMTAENIIKRAATGLSFYDTIGVKPKINAEYEDRGNSITGFIDIHWRKMKEIR